MSAIDIFFLAGFVLALGLMLATSRAIRAIAWDTLRHPFTKGTVMFHADRVEVRHDKPTDESRKLSPSGSR